MEVKDARRADTAELGSNVDDPSDWPVQQPHLRLLDQSLRCPICKDVYNSAMYLPTCTHAFCSLCVRRALQTEAKCPVCRVNAQESMLKKCGWLDDAAFHFKKARAELLPILKQHYNRSGNNASSRSQSSSRASSAAPLSSVSSVSSVSSAAEDLPRSTATPAPTATTAPTTSRMTTRSQSAASNSASSAPQGRRAKMVIIDTDDEDVDNDNDDDDDDDDDDSYNDGMDMKSLNANNKSSNRSRSTSRIVDDDDYNDSDDEYLTSRSNRNSQLTKRRKVTTSTASTVSAASAQQSTTQKTVECPICNKYIYESAINAHIDKCLKNQGNADDDGGNNVDNEDEEDEFITAQSSRPQSSRSSSTTLAARTASSRLPPASFFQQTQLSSMSISTTITKNQPKPTKLVYSVLTEKRLREVLKELQLPAHGDRQTMQQRHQEFVNIYNANQDSREPRSYKQLVSDLTHWELRLTSSIQQQQQQQQRSSLFGSLSSPALTSTTSSLNRSATQISSTATSNSTAKPPQSDLINGLTRAEYLDTYKAEFDEMVEELRQRRAQKNLAQEKEMVDEAAASIST